MANSTKAKPTFKAGTITPPPVNSGRTRAIPDELVSAIYAAIKGTGEYGTITNDDGSPVTYSGDKGRQQAGTAATRLKKALLNSPDTHYDDPKAIKSRVWDSGGGAYAFAVYERADTESVEDSGD